MVPAKPKHTQRKCLNSLMEWCSHLYAVPSNSRPSFYPPNTQLRIPPILFLGNPLLLSWPGHRQASSFPHAIPSCSPLVTGRHSASGSPQPPIYIYVAHLSMLVCVCVRALTLFHTTIYIFLLYNYVVDNFSCMFLRQASLLNIFLQYWTSVSVFSSSTIVRSVRCLLALRPLRIISHIWGMKVSERNL